MQENIRKVGITGAAGHIGSTLVEALGGKYELTLIDRQIIPPSIARGHKTLCTEIEHADEVKNIFDGLDAVIHLAGNRRAEGLWDSIHNNNIVGTYNVLEECRRAGVKRVVFTSSNHVQHGHTIRTTPETLDTKFYSKGKLLTLSDPTQPDSIYAVSKVFGEELCKLYAKKYGIQIVSLRVGWTIPEDTPLAMKGTSAEDYLRAMFLSKRDCVQAFSRALEVPMKAGNYLVAYAISNNGRRVFDLTETRKTLGYNPQDDAEEFFKSPTKH